MANTRVFVGNLPLDTEEHEIEDLFYKYGRIRRVDLRTPLHPPAYAFVEFEYARDAEDAVVGRNGGNFDGRRLRVELSHSRGNNNSSDRGYERGNNRGYERGSDRAGDRGYDTDRRNDKGYGSSREYYDTGRGNATGYSGSSRDQAGYGGSARRYPDRGGAPGRDATVAPSRTDHRVIVSGLPPNTSWQDVKDHLRRAGEVTFAQIVTEGRAQVGLVDFATRDDMLNAVRKLDDTELKNPFGSSFIRVQEDRGAGARDVGRGRAQQRSRSPARLRSRTRSQSRSPPHFDDDGVPTSKASPRSEIGNLSPLGAERHL